MPIRAVRLYQPFKGDNGKWGVELDDTSVLYEADFTERQAKRLAELENSFDPPEDWEAAREILERERLITKKR